MFIRAFATACSTVAIGCIVGGSVVLFTVNYHNSVTRCEPPTVETKINTLFGDVKLCRAKR